MGKYDKYFEKFNEVVLDLEKSITLYYPPLNTTCPNCVVDTFAGVITSTGRYIPGGPIAFTNGDICPYCNGQGVKEIAQTDRVKGRMYTTTQINKGPLLIVDAEFTFLTLLDNLTKIRNASYCIPNDGTEQVLNQKFQLSKSPRVTNFTLNPVQYIECVWTILK